MQWVAVAATVTVLVGVYLLGAATKAPALALGKTTGFGATVKAWEATHIADHRGNLAPGCCFDPMPVPGLLYGDRYYAVQPMDGLVISYEMHLKPTTVSRARAMAMHELPPDARVKSFTAHGNSCAILIASSASLGAALERDSAYLHDVKRTNAFLGTQLSPTELKAQVREVVVEFSSGASGTTYKSSAVSDLLFSSLAVVGSRAQNC